MMQSAFNFHLSLKLPQHVYHVTDRSVEVVGTARKAIIPGIGLLFESNLGGTLRQLFSADKENRRWTT